jgi:hypothetical protein
MLFVFVVFTKTYGQLQTNRILVRGYLISKDLQQPVPLVSILNKSSNTRYVSNRKGLYSIYVSQNDTVIFTGIGYKTMEMRGYELMPANLTDTINLLIEPFVYKLKDVTVVYSNAKRDSIARLAAEFLKTDPLMNNYDRILKRDRGGMMSPLTAMYEAFSKEGQDMVRFEEFLQYSERLKQVDKRYNKKVIKRVTGLPDSQLDAFILYCKLDHDFILQAQEYDLLLAIKKCADNFAVLKK